MGYGISIKSEFKNYKRDLIIYFLRDAWFLKMLSALPQSVSNKDYIFQHMECSVLNKGTQPHRSNTYINEVRKYLSGQTKEVIQKILGYIFKFIWAVALAEGFRMYKSYLGDKSKPRL